MTKSLLFGVWRTDHYSVPERKRNQKRKCTNPGDISSCAERRQLRDLHLTFVKNNSLSVDTSYPHPVPTFEPENRRKGEKVKEEWEKQIKKEREDRKIVIFVIIEITLITLVHIQSIPSKMAHQFLLIIVIHLLLFLCTVTPTSAQQLRSCGRLDVCFAIDEIYYDARVQKRLLSAVPIFSQALQDQFYSVRFFATGRVGKRVIRRYIESIDQLNDFRLRRRSSLPLPTGNFSLRTAVTSCRNHLASKSAPKVMIMITDKFVAMSEMQSFIISQKIFPFKLLGTTAVTRRQVGGENVETGVQFDTFKQLGSEPRLSAFQTTAKWSPLVLEFFKRYMSKLVPLKSKCAIVPPPPTPKSRPIAYNGQSSVTSQLLVNLSTMPYDLPRVRSRLDLRPFKTTDTLERSAVKVRDAFELFLWEELNRANKGKRVAIKSAVAVTELATSSVGGSLGNLSARYEQEVIHNSCYSNQCAAKVVVQSTVPFNQHLAGLAIDQLRERQGFRQVFFSRPWGIHKEALTPNNRWWEVRFNFRISGGNSNADR